MKAYIDNTFWLDPSDEKSGVYKIESDVFSDSRGCFTEVIKDIGQWSRNDQYPLFLSNLQWIRQINRSSSIPCVCRGMHSQSSIFCQSKLVECVHGLIYDFVIDARPNSPTFGIFECYPLFSEHSNKIFLGKGFLHGFYSSEYDIHGNKIEKNIFQYYLGGGTYNKQYEINVNMESILPQIVSSLKQRNTDIYNPFIKNYKKIILSDKDKKGFEYHKWMDQILMEYKKTNKLWYM